LIHVKSMDVSSDDLSGYAVSDRSTMCFPDDPLLGYFDRDEAQVPRFFEGRRAAGDQALARARLGVSGR
jgi:hypothetical protein